MLKKYHPGELHKKRYNFAPDFNNFIIFSDSPYTYKQ